MTQHDTNSRATVAVTGASGLVGHRLCDALRGRQMPVLALTRGKPGEGEAQWSVESGLVQPEAFSDVRAVVHLAGENISSGRWTEEQKRKIRSSRVQGTASICRSLATLSPRPEVLVCASAIGYYGNRGDEVMTEESAPGTDFLSEVCTAWEAAAEPAREAGIRVLHLRFGVILSRDGGALQEMLIPFRLGLGGRVGSGRQYMSWISLDDVVGAIIHTLERDDLSGPMNVVAPNPVTNQEFTKTLGRFLGRPTVFPLPAFVARLAMGQMADELLLSSTRVAPDRLIASGYEFQHPNLEEALRSILNR